MSPRTPVLVALALLLTPVAGAAQQGFHFPGDRNDGIPVSMFGTSVRAGEVLVYPFYEYYRDDDSEYSPDELGYGLDEDFRAPSRGHEVLLFVGWGVTDRLALEFEAALWTKAWQDKAPDDPTAMPARIEESGLGDVEGQVRWRWTDPASEGSDLFTYFEYVLPLQKDEVLIGTAHWEFKLGTGYVRDFAFGSLGFRLAAEYDGEDGKVEPGEYAVEWWKRLSETVRVFAALEGSEDELEAIPVLMWAPVPNVALHLNSAFGVTSKAEDWAPEIGVMISLR